MRPQTIDDDFYLATLKDFGRHDVRRFIIQSKKEVSGKSKKTLEKSKCKKVRFRDHLEAVEALKTIRVVRLRNTNQGTETRRRECRTYFCHRCRGHHLTSKASFLESVGS
jgi:hypothetical protein